jgi:CheY-like chemotaxis protein
MNYDIMVVDDDPIVLEDTTLMYEEMIRFGDFDGIFGKDAHGSVSRATNTKEAEEKLSESFEKQPKLVELLHVDERMPDERGSEFMDRMRWSHAGRRIGALLVTGYATDVSVINSREKGVYRYLSKPVTAELIKPHLDDIIKVIFSKEKPLKKDLVHSFNFRELQKMDDLLDYFRLRYSVFQFMNYLQQKNKQSLDIDKFDPYAIPIGGFIRHDDGTETLVSTIRVVTDSLQEPYHTLIERIIDEYPVDIRLTDTSLNSTKIRTLRDFVRSERRGAFPAAESFHLANSVDFYTNNGQTVGEFSRIIDHPDYRGYGLSKISILAAIAEVRHRGGPQMIYGACVPQHVPMYEKYGWHCIDGIGLTLETKVQQVALAMVCNVFTDVTEEYDTLVEEQILPQLTTKSNIAYPFR